MYGELCSVKEITEGVRAVINSRQEQLSDAEVLALIEGLCAQGPPDRRLLIQDQRRIDPRNLQHDA